MNIKKYPGTKNILWQAIANMPDQTIWLSWNNQLGDLLRSEQRWDDAISTYESILEHDADYWQAYIGLGWANYDRNDGIEAAMSEIKKVSSSPQSQENGQFAKNEMLTCEKRFEEVE
jgi:tetratricopeptide (TPR) repeat protein